MEKLPTFTVDLLQELDQMYPPITGGDVRKLDYESLRRKAAKREVVEHLLDVHRLEQERKDV